MSYVICPVSLLAGKTVGTGRKREVILVGILDKFLVYIFCHKEQRFHEEVIESYKLNIFNIILINQLEVKLLGKHNAVLLSLSHVLYQVLVICPMSYVIYPLKVTKVTQLHNGLTYLCRWLRKFRGSDLLCD